MRAETAEIQREDVGHLLVPMVHVERSINRGTTILSVEIPDEQLMHISNRKEARRLISSILNPIGDTFLKWWETRNQ